ncbi:class I glutamine amidotransferase-like protein [Cyathus striatus]|nr:class I glutamine amidotransferase-like protein [Cyathus striatus]
MENSVSAPVRIALLICGALTGKAYADNGDYTNVFRHFLSASLPAPCDYVLDPYDVVTAHQYPTDAQLDSYHTVLYTGSAASAYENIEWINKLVAFTKHVAENKPNVKLIGICFGHQIIARALGGECVPNGGKWEVGPTPVKLTEVGKQIFGVEEMNIQEMHRDHVPDVLPGFELLGGTGVSANQGMVKWRSGAEKKSLKDVHIITLQGHPEFTENIVSSLVEARSSSGVIDKEAAEDAEKRKHWRNDGVSVVGKVLWGC